MTSETFRRCLTQQDASVMCWSGESYPQQRPVRRKSIKLISWRVKTHEIAGAEDVCSKENKMLRF